VFKCDRFQSFFAVGSLDTFSAMPTGNGLSPILWAVPDCDISQDETFVLDIASFVAGIRGVGFG
jgi:hypothetical protein